MFHIAAVCVCVCVCERQTERVQRRQIFYPGAITVAAIVRCGERDEQKTQGQRADDETAE